MLRRKPKQAPATPPTRAAHTLARKASIVMLVWHQVTKQPPDASWRVSESRVGCHHCLAHVTPKNDTLISTPVYIAAIPFSSRTKPR
jgi:hypothetical protein